MSTLVALLRGINVGKAKRIAMADLRALLGAMGYSAVATLLNSGNAVFRAAEGTAAGHAVDIAAAIAARLKVEVPVVVKTAKELAAIVAENRLAGSAPDHSRLLAVFVQDPKALSALGAIGPLVQSPEEFVIGKRAAYLHCANGILQSKAGSVLLGKFATLVTTRNWKTVLKLHAMVCSNDA